MLLEKKIIKTKKSDIKTTINWYEKILNKYNVDLKALLIFNELLMNAYEHGNLGLKNKDKMILENKYENFLNEKEQYCKKLIKIFFYRVGNYFITKICDEGNGFDIYSINIKKYSGRGIFISRKLSDGLFYNKKGNKVCFFIKNKN
ncbi:ATP-binding protein [Nautilia lithotrophica]